MSGIEANRLSRASDPTDWTLADYAWRVLEVKYGPHTVDRMASLNNAKTERYNSRYPDPRRTASRRT